VIAMLSNSPHGWSLRMIVSVIGFFVGLGFWLGHTLRKLGEVPSTFGSAKWAQPEEMSAEGLFVKDGIRLGRVMDGESEREIFYHGERHCLISAPTRSQKGTSQIVPNLLAHEGSVVTIDPKGENALMTAKARQDMGQKVMVVDPWQIAIIEGLEAARFNPLEWLVFGERARARTRIAPQRRISVIPSSLPSGTRRPSVRSRSQAAQSFPACFHPLPSNSKTISSTQRPRKLFCIAGTSIRKDLPWQRRQR
jgi:hypothetical protein